MNNELTVEQKVWLVAWVNTARADNCDKPVVATKWADECLNEFKKRFNINIKELS